MRTLLGYAVDVLALIGFGVLVFGVYLIHLPTSLIVAGAGLMAGSYLFAVGDEETSG